MKKDEIIEKLRENLKTMCNIGEDGPSNLETLDIFSEGYITSMSLVQYIRFLESAFNILIDEDYLYDDRFITLEGQADIVQEIIQAQ